MVTRTDNSSQERRPITFGKLIAGSFIRRENRFRAIIDTQDGETIAHLPNSGRLAELLVPGQEVWLKPAIPSSINRRKTAFDLVIVVYGDQLVSVDARLPNRLVAQCLRNDQLPGHQGVESFKQEVRFGGSRLDFQLVRSSPPAIQWVEVKSVTLVEGGIARFPDAPTSRGKRHLEELIHSIAMNHRASVVFVVQRNDVEYFQPNDRADPAFCTTLRRARDIGVNVIAIPCRVTLSGVTILDPITIRW